MIKLRPYQETIINSLRNSIKLGNKKIVLCSPTGSGKTIMFTYMIKEHLEKGGSVLLFTHRKELLNQAGGTFSKFDLNPELITAGSNPDLTKNLHVSMIETFSRRKKEYCDFIKKKSLIVIDEAHLNTFTKIFDYIDKNTFVIGATATPYRKGKDTPALSEFYTDIVQEIDTPELLSLGFLSPAHTYGVKVDLSKAKKKGDDYNLTDYYDKNKTYKGVVSNWKRIADNTKTILFSSNIESSITVCNEFKANGYNAKHIDGNTPKNERESILEWFDKTPNAIICNCGILNAGFDQPDIETIILYRATTSLPLFLQMCGRGSRLSPNKTHFNILDFGNNISRLNYWEHPRKWSLEKDKKRQTKEDAINLKECKKCSALVSLSVKICPYCGKEFVKEQKEKDEEEIAYLELLPKKQIMRKSLKQDNKTLVRYCKAKLISPSWVLHNKKNKQDALDFISLMGYKKGWLHYNKDRFAVFRR